MPGNAEITKARIVSAAADMYAAADQMALAGLEQRPPVAENAPLKERQEVAARDASDDLYNAYKNGEVSDRKAAVIAYAAKGDKAIENAGLRAAKNMSAEQLAEFLRLLNNIPKEKRVASTGDLFGFDDSAIKTAEAVSKLALKKIKELESTLSAAESAIKNPDAAAKLKVKVGKQAQALRGKMRAELARWQHYDTDPELYQQLREEAGLEAETPKPPEAPKAAEAPQPKETPQVKTEAPKETPKTAPKVESPKVETPKVETSKAEPKKDETSKAPETPTSGKIEDFGEKIGGARKDLAEKTGPRTKTAKETETGPDGNTRLYNLKRNGKAYYDVPFSEGLKRVVDPAQKSNRDPVYVRDTPEVFRQIGFTALPMMVNARHARLNYYTESEFKAIYGNMHQGEHAHGLHDTLTRVPQELEHPIAIVANLSQNAQPGSVVAITDINVNEKKVVVPVLIEATSTGDGVRIDSHLLLTVYDAANWIDKFIKPALAAEKKGVGVFYVDTKKAARYSALSGLVKGSIPSGVIHNINDPGSPVKGIFKKQTETLQFQRWFKKSKVVDANGKPLVVYHDTNAKIYVNKETGENWDDLDWKAREEWEERDDWDEHWKEQDFYTFSRVRARRSIEYPGFFFRPTPDPHHEYGSRRIAAYLSIQNPAINPTIENAGVYDDSGEVAMKKLIEQGYDGIIRTDKNGNVEEYIAFYPEQIKSATDNIGTFDPNNPDIRYSLKRHNQVNPIREAGAIRDQHQTRINSEYTVRPSAEVNRDAERTIERLGGAQGAINAISSGDYTPTSDTAQRVVQVVLNSKEFKDSDAEVRGKIADIYINHLGTDVARALAARRLGALNLADLQSIQAHVNAFVAKIDQMKPDNKIREQILKEFGFDIDALPDDILQDQGKLDALIRKLAAERASWGDKLYEYWINAILSGPSTHAANTLGNTANAAYELGVKRFIEALVNTVARRKDAATFGEFKAMLHAFDWRNAFRRAKLAYDYGALSVDGGKLEQVRTAIGGKTGRLIRTPGRLLRAADENGKNWTSGMTSTCGKKRICARIWPQRRPPRVAIPRRNTPVTMIIYRPAAKSHAENSTPAQRTCPTANRSSGAFSSTG